MLDKNKTKQKLTFPYRATGIFPPILQSKTPPTPSSWIGFAGVQQSLSHATDSQLD